MAEPIAALRAQLSMDSASFERGAKKASKSLSGLSKQAGAAKKEVEAAGAGLRAASTGAIVYGANALKAGRHTANLTAQFNDIGVMLAAGQNPLQLAMQQGTQITQVFAQMGVTGKDAFGVILGGLRSMISPLNLATIGIIAGGAALTNWAFSAGEAEKGAEDLEKQLQQVTDAGKEAAQNVRKVRLGVDDNELTLLDQLADKRRLIALSEEDLSRSGAVQRKNIRDRIAETQKEIETLQARLDALRGNTTEIEKHEKGLREISDIERMLGEQVQDALRQRALSAFAAEKEAATLLRAMSSQNDMAAVALAHGRDSEELARARAWSEHKATLEMIEALGVSEDMQTALEAAASDAYHLARADIASTISAGASKAQKLANWLGVALSTALELSAVTPAMADEDAVMSQQVVPDAGMRAGHRTAKERFARLTRPNGRSGVEGGANREHTQRLREAEQVMRRLETATQAYNRELADLQELYNLGYLKADQFRAAQEHLSQQFAEQEFGDVIRGFESVADAIAGAIVNSESLGETFKNVIKQMVAELISSNIRNLLLSTFNIGARRSRGGFLGNLFAGFFDSGGNIPRGQFGIVGERGPELVQGPAQVTSRKDTAAMMGSRLNVSVSVDGGGNLKALVRDEAGKVVASSAPTIASRVQKETFPRNAADYQERG